MTNKYNFGRDAFRVWLRKNPTQKFRRCSTGSCPLAVFAKEGCGYKKVSIDNVEIKLDGKTYNAKRWHSNFIDIVDQGSGRVSAKEAYRILNLVNRGGFNG